MELVDTNLPEAREFVFSLTDNEKRYYKVNWNRIASEAIYIKGYRDGDELIGIAGVYQKYFVAFATFLMIKETHWSKGFGTKMLAESLLWMRHHHIPYDIFKYDSRNVATARIHAKLGIKDDVRIGDSYYNVVPLSKWATFLKYPILTLIRCRNIIPKPTPQCVGATNVKRVYYEPIGRIHSSQWELINNPPEGYEFITSSDGLVDRIVRNDFIFDKLRLQILDRLVPLNYVKAKIDAKKKLPSSTDLVFAYNHLVFRKVPWVVLVEWANILIGRDLRFFEKYARRVEEILSSEYCKGVITWSEIAKESILQNYDTSNFEDKIKVIPHAVKRTGYIRNYNRGSVKLLFVGSTNTPEDFDAKGATDVIEAFRVLKTKHKDLELTIRARTPENIHNADGLTIVDSILPKRELARLFEDADVFVLPSHFAHEMVIVEAMSYGLPVVTSWIGSTCGEYVDDGNTGLVLPRSNTTYFTDNMMLISETIHRHELIKSARNDLDALVSSLERLIESPKLRERIGKKAKAEVDSGRFSIKHRNEALLEILK